MTLIAAIDTFNKTSHPKIEVLIAPDGRAVARLPRLGREIVVKGSSSNRSIKVSSQDVALLCEEAQLAVAPGMALLEAALAAMGKVARGDEHELV